MHDNTPRKILTCIICILLIFVSMTGCRADQYKRDIFQLVENNKQVLLDDIAEKDFTDSRQINLIERIYGLDRCVSFYCGGFGLSASSQEFGFYYAYVDAPLGVWEYTVFCSSQGLTPDGEGYSANYQHNSYYTEKICDHFYYYKLIF